MLLHVCYNLKTRLFVCNMSLLGHACAVYMCAWKSGCMAQLGSCKTHAYMELHPYIYIILKYC